MMGEARMNPNSELIQFAKKFGYETPKDYYVVQFVKEWLDNDFNKFRTSYPFYPDEIRLELTNRTFKTIFQPYVHASTLTYDEAKQRAEKSTSPGFPLNLYYKTRGEAFDKEDDLIRSIVYQVLLHGKVNYVFRGVRYDKVYWKTSPKAEIRPMEKLANPDPKKRKIRTFMCCDMILYLVGLMLYGNQNDNFLLLANTNHWSAVGMTIYYGGWNRLVKILFRNLTPQQRSSFLEKNFDCYDIAHMESSFNDFIQNEIYELRHSGIDGYVEGKQFFFNNVAYSFIIDPDGNLTLKTGKNPSGSINTLQDNSFALIWVWLYVLSEFFTTIESLVGKYHELAMKIMGDDTIVETDPALNNLQVQAKFIGFEITKEVETGPLSSARFLNMGFVFDQGRQFWMFQPNFEKLRASIYYHFKNRSWRLCFAKLCAMRVLVYPYYEYRLEIDRLIAYVVTEHEQDMINEMHMNDVLTYTAAKCQYKDDKQIEFLIYGDEYRISG